MKTCAKINLFLKVLGTRPDGYHELETVFLPIPELYDDVTVTVSDKRELSFTCDVTELNTPGNLCMKAARAFCEKTAVEPCFRISLIKRIPVAAGLGGGSSDAAATLLQLNQLISKPLSRNALVRLAASVGADVPFFLNPTPSAATGIGDVLSPITISTKLNVLVASPGIPIPVKWAYDHCKSQPTVTLQDFLQTCAAKDAEAIAKLCHNDLEYAIFDKFPLLCMMRDQLLADGALCVHVSGSGSSLFALLPQQNAHAIRENFNATFQDVPTLTVSP
ncbi:MAG: 4-(cytidine 5'-diphospho)-2-C-methyl-D-erythritol kinase [Victivallales bacterium]|nr:4-(cytidine 5'-diphospho)-2-C-methyl-D-erythritol kinase [Victivallales bacterium]